MDDVTAAKEKQRPTGQPRAPRQKYMDQLQEVADRKRNEILIELDDVDNVRPLRTNPYEDPNRTGSMRRTSASTRA